VLGNDFRNKYLEEKLSPQVDKRRLKRLKIKKIKIKVMRHKIQAIKFKRGKSIKDAKRYLNGLFSMFANAKPSLGNLKKIIKIVYSKRK